MRRPSPRKDGDIEQGVGSPIRNIDPPTDSSPTFNTYRSSQRSSNTSNDNNTNNNNTNNQSPLCKFLTKLLPPLLRDTIYGVTIGLLFLLTLFLLDYHSIISIGSTKAFQSVGMELLSDPEVITAIESTLDIKLMPLDGYTAMKAEIASNLELIQSHNKDENALLVKYTNQLSSLSEEIKSIQMEHTKLTQEITTKLGLEAWCGECKGNWGRCDQRVEYLKNTYGNSVMMSKAGLIKEGLCIKK
eukprot:scaffold4424_cov154-Skeletonema_menzelii.AAC.1